jgi:hypothetical protein
MAAGNVLSTQDINSLVGGLARDFLSVLQRANNLCTLMALSQYDDAVLAAAPYNMAAGDIAEIRSYLTDVQQALALLTGAQTLTTAKDFRTNAFPLAGSF